MMKQFFPGLFLLIGLCVFSAVLQTLHIVEMERVKVGPAASKVANCDCNDCRPAVRPSR
jgi:hypothetical protein